MSQNKNIQYLDLQLPTGKTLVTENKHSCYFNKNFKHSLHTDNKQLNSVTDLVIQLGISLEEHQERFYRIVESITRHMTKRNEILQEVNNKLDFIKNTENFNKLSLDTLPSKIDILQLSSLIDNNKPKDIELQSKELLVKIKQQSEENKIIIQKEINTLNSILKTIQDKQLA